MKKFIVLYHAPAELMQSVGEKTPEEAKESMKPWMEWAQKCGSGLVDLGAPLGNGQTVTTSGSNPSDKQVVGYSVLQAESMEAAQAMLQGHPHLAWSGSCSIEVHEALPMPQ
jgi:hypothetical protein